MPRARHTTSRDINAAERGRLALELRKAGHTLEQIAAACGYANRSSAFQAIKRELDRIPVESAKELRTVEFLRLEHLSALVLPAVVIGDTSDEETKDESDEDEKPKKKKRKVDLFAVDRLIAISERRAKLMGLDISPDNAVAANIIVVREMPPNYLGLPEQKEAGQ
jgi:hypothetical protein